MISRTGTGGAAATTPPSPAVTERRARSRSRIAVIGYIVPREGPKRSPAEAGASRTGEVSGRMCCLAYEPLEGLLVELLLVPLGWVPPVVVLHLVVGVVLAGRRPWNPYALRWRRRRVRLPAICGSLVVSRWFQMRRQRPGTH